MTKGRLQQVTNQFRAQLAAREALAEQQIEQAYRHVSASIQPELGKLLRQIAAMQADGAPIPVSWLYQQRRLIDIQRFIQVQIDHFGMLTYEQVAALQQETAALGSRSAQQLLETTLPSGAQPAFNLPNPRAIESLVGATQAGSPLASLFSGFGDEAANGAKQALVRGVTLGSNPAWVARDIQQALSVSRMRALTIAQTEMMRAYNGAALANYRANSNLVNGWVWIADLAGACIACVDMHGSIHPLDEDMASHVRCRCTMAPMTASYSNILGGDGASSESADMGMETGAAWFANQSARTQLSILGKARYQAYQDGTPIADMVGTKHDARWGSSVYVKPLKDLKKAS